MTSEVQWVRAQPRCLAGLRHGSEALAAAIRVRLVVLLLTAAFLAGCGSNGSPAVERVHPATSPSPSAPDTGFSGLVDIGGGRHLYAVCEGTRKPTILLEAGDESDSHQWAAVMPRLVDHARTCAYERLGVGSSDPASQCRGPADLLGDTEALLKALGETGPYVLVGHSGGGFLMADYAYAHPEQVLGLVLVETPEAINPERAPKSLLAEINCHAATNEEHRDYVAVENFAWSHRHRIGDIPMTVISNRFRPPYDDYEQPTNVRDQRGWFVLSPQARQVVVTSGHEVEETQPDLVAREIRHVLSAISRN